MRTAVRLNTVGVIAEILGKSISRINYVIKSRPHIAHVATAGNARLYDEKAVAMIRHEINAMDARRAGGRRHA